jgi:nucleotide-binding universal stress UspA family protein
VSRNEILVGVDGSTQSRAALRFAATEAHRHSAVLRIVAAYRYEWRAARFGGAEKVERTVRERYEEIVGIAEQDARAAAPEVTVTAAAVAGDAGEVLVDAAHNAKRLIVGNRGHGGFGSLMLGSVSQYVATHARIPVIVVRGDSDTVEKPVVVGVDHSSRSELAIGTAFEEAAVRHTGVIAMHAYAVPLPAWTAGRAPIPYDPERVRLAAVDDLNTALAPWRDRHPDVPVEAVVGEGGAARMLVDVSHSAALVVVGSRGIGATTGMLLGSVGLQLLHHADSPVLIAH